ncbi:MAG: hypothetical protein H3C41_02140 [Bacteroidales bacterium]|nr:hypothetical protein [Bacteroidales bacterium]
MNKIIVRLMLFLPGFFLFSCIGKEEVEHLQCQLEATTDEIEGNNIMVIYAIEGNGNYHVDSWVYLAPEGEIKKQSLALPVSDTLFFSSRVIPKTTAKVKVTDGWVRIGFKAQTEDKEFSGSDKCEQYINP